MSIVDAILAILSMRKEFTLQNESHAESHNMNITGKAPWPKLLPEASRIVGITRKTSEGGDEEVIDGWVVVGNMVVTSTVGIVVGERLVDSVGTAEGAFVGASVMGILQTGLPSAAHVVPVTPIGAKIFALQDTTQKTIRASRAIAAIAGAFKCGDGIASPEFLALDSAGSERRAGTGYPLITNHGASSYT